MKHKAENSTPQAESRLSTALPLVGSERHSNSSLPTQSLHVYVAQPLPQPPLPSWQQVRNAKARAQSQAMCSANPPGPLSKEKGTHPRALSGNWRCKKRAAAAAQLVGISDRANGYLLPASCWAMGSYPFANSKCLSSEVSHLANSSCLSWKTKTFLQPMCLHSTAQTHNYPPHHLPLCSIRLCSQP